jgi:ABC-type transporter Mla subunit MlaD
MQFDTGSFQSAASQESASVPIKQRIAAEVSQATAGMRAQLAQLDRLITAANERVAALNRRTAVVADVLRKSIASMQCLTRALDDVQALAARVKDRANGVRKIPADPPSQNDMADWH